MTGRAGVDVFARVGSYDVPPPPAFVDVTEGDALERFGIDGRPLGRIASGALFRLSGLRSFASAGDVERERILRTADSRRFDHPLALAATLALRDDPGKPTVRERAVSLVVAAASHAVEITTGRYEQLTRRSGAPEEMGQFPNLFGTGLRFEGPHTTLVRTEHPTTLAVACLGRLHLVDLGPPSTWSVGRVDEALGRILDDSTRGNQPFGLVSAASERVRSSAIDRIRADVVGAESLERLESVLFTLCLHPDRDGGAPAKMFAAVHGEVHRDRWFGSSLQLVVHRDGASAAIANFRAWLDGNTMIRGIGDISRRAREADGPIDVRAEPPASISELRAANADDIGESAAADVAAHLRRSDRPIIDLPFGSDRLGCDAVGPVDSFTVAVALSVRRRTGQVPRIGQAVSASGYACGELQFAPVPTAEFVAVVDAMTDPYRDLDERAALLVEAATAHRRSLRAVRSVVQIEALRRIRDVSTVERWPARLENLGLRLLRAAQRFDPAAPSVLLSHPSIDDEFTALGRPGALMPWCPHYALHYLIHDAHTQVAIAGGPALEQSDAEVWADLERSLDDVASLVERLSA